MLEYISIYSAQGHVDLRTRSRWICGHVWWRNAYEEMGGMQLKLTTDYAVRILVGLAQAQGRVATAELGARLHIPRTYISKIMVHLKEQGWLSVKEGSGGGYMLAISPGDITLRQILEAMSDELKLCQCLGDAGTCSWRGAGECAMRRVYQPLQQRVDEMLDGITLAELARGTLACETRHLEALALV